MTENGFDIQTITTKRTDKQADYILLLRQVTEKKEKAHPSHFSRILLASRKNSTLLFTRNTALLFENPKSRFFSQP